MRAEGQRIGFAVLIWIHIVFDRVKPAPSVKGKILYFFGSHTVFIQ